MLDKEDIRVFDVKITKNNNNNNNIITKVKINNIKALNILRFNLF